MQEGQPRLAYVGGDNLVSPVWGNNLVSPIVRQKNYKDAKEAIDEVYSNDDFLGIVADGYINVRKALDAAKKLPEQDRKVAFLGIVETERERREISDEGLDIRVVLRNSPEHKKSLRDISFEMITAIMHSCSSRRDLAAEVS